MFFVKKRKFGNGRTKSAGKKDKIQVKKRKGTKSDEEITSSEDEPDKNLSNDEPESENEFETAQEKRLRLAKVYLEEIQQEEKRRAEDDSIDDHVISKRLREDYLQQSGKLQKKVAARYVGVVTEFALRCKDHNRSITCVCLASDGNYIYSGSKDGSIVKWSVKDKKRIASVPFLKGKLPESKPFLGHRTCINSMALSCDGKYLAVADETKDIQIWNPDNLTHVRTFTGHRGAVTSLAFRKDTHTLYSCSCDKSVKVWSLAEMMYVETLYGHQNAVLSIDAGAKERPITGGGKDGTLRLWKIVEESQLIFNSPAGSVDCVKFVNEDCFVSAGDSGELCVWSTQKKRPLCSVKAAHGYDATNNQPLWITSLATLRNTDLIASGCQDGYIRLWKLGEGFKTISKLFEIPVRGFVNAIAFSNDGKYLVAGIGQEHRLGRWNVIKDCRNSVVIFELQKTLVE